MSEIHVQTCKNKESTTFPIIFYNNNQYNDNEAQLNW